MGVLELGLKAVAKGIDKTAHTVKSFNELGKLVGTEKAKMASEIRSSGGYMGDAVEQNPLTDQELKMLYKALIHANGFDVAPTAEMVRLTGTTKPSTLDIINLFETRVGQDRLTKLLDSAKLKLTKPLYATRDDHYASGTVLKNTPDHHLLSFRAVKPTNPETPGIPASKTAQLYKVPAGTSIYHLGTHGEGPELLLKAGDAKKLQTTSVDKYKAALKKGAALFSAGGAIAATQDPNNAEASVASTLAKTLAKGIDKTAHTPESFAKLAPKVPELTATAHKYRKVGGVHSLPGYNFDMSPEELKKAVALADKLMTSKHKPAISKADEKLLARLDKSPIGLDLLTQFLEPSKITLDKPLYITRSETYSVGDPNSPGHYLHSALVVDPKDPKTYGKDAKVYKLPAGTKVFHPGGQADKNEVVLTRSALKSAEAFATVKDYRESLKKGAALFSAGGIAAATQDPNNAEASMIPGLTEGVAQAARVGTKKSIESGTILKPLKHDQLAQDQQDQNQDPAVAKVQEFLAQKANPKDVLSVLTEKFGVEKANAVMLQAIQPKLDAFRAQGAKEEDIQSVLGALGLSAPQQTQTSTPIVAPSTADSSTPVDPSGVQVASALPVDPKSDPGAANTPRVNTPFTASSPGPLAKAFNALTGNDPVNGNPLGLPKEGVGLPSPDKAVAQVNAMKSGYKETALMLSDLAAKKVGLSPSHTAEIKAIHDETVKFKTKILQGKGYNVDHIDEQGTIWIKHPTTGEVQPYEESVFSIVPYTYKEAALGTAGAIVGASLFVGAAPAVVGAAVVGAAGAVAGRAIDVLTAADDLHIKTDKALLISEMKQAGVADLTFSSLGITGLATNRITKATHKAVRSAWDKFVAGNKEGAVKALLDANNMNEAKAIEQVQQWERVTGHKLLSDQARADSTLGGAQDQNAVLRTITQTTPGNEGVVRASTSEATKAGAPLNAEIAARAKEFNTEASKLTNDNIDSLIQDKLGTYVAQTKQTFEDVKNLGLDAMAEAPYKFNFVTTALIPAMKAQAKGIHNGALRKDFYSYLDRIRELGGETQLGEAAGKTQAVSADLITKKTLAEQAKTEAEAVLTKSKAAHQGTKDTLSNIKSQVATQRSQIAALKTERQALRGKQAAAAQRVKNLKTKKARDRAAAEVTSVGKELAKLDKQVIKASDTLATTTKTVSGATQDVAIAAKQVTLDATAHRIALSTHKAAALAAKPKPLAEQPVKSAATLESTNQNRTFKNLLELRQVINELSSDTRFKSFNTFKQMKETKASVDKEIERAALTHMPEGKAWLNQWRLANQEYFNMKTLEGNVLYKTLTSPRVSADTAVQAIAKSMSYTDPSTFMQVMRRMGSSRTSVEGAVLKHFIQKHSVGFEGGKQAINFPELAAELDKISFTQGKAQDFKRTVKLFAGVFKNDPNLLAATGGIPLPRFQQSLAVDPVSKAKYAIASVMFNAIRARIPFSNNAGRAALVNNLGKILDNPLDNQAISIVTKALPKNPELKTSFHQLAQAFKETGQPEHYGKVPIYRAHQPGEFNKPTKTFLGEGMLYYTDRSVAKQIAKEIPGMKMKEVMQLQKRIAIPWDVEKLLGHPPSPAELRDPEVQQLLRNKDFAGLAVQDKVLLFKQ